MKLLLNLFACLYLFPVGIKANGSPDFNVGLVELRAVLGIAANVSLVQITNSSGVTLSTRTNETYTNPNVLIRFELRANSWPVYDAGVTAEFFTNGTYAGFWAGGGAEIIVRDNGVPRISSRRALYILARKFNLCPQKISRVELNDISLLYLMDPDTKFGRLIYRASFMHYGQVTSLGNETTETMQPTALIDANTGVVIQSWNGFSSQSAAATTIKAFGGNKGKVLGLRTYPALAVGLLPDGRCIYSTPDVEVQDMASKTDMPFAETTFAATTFACSAPSSTAYDNANDGYSPLNDAMSHAQTTVDMYRKYTKANGPQDIVPVKLRVHYGVNYGNAFWSSTGFATFGDGDPSAYYPMVTLDNVAHELGHAYTARFSGLEYVSESGGINEAFSDMSGQAAIFFAGGQPNFTPGNELTKSGKPLRDMCNPPSDGKSIDKYSAFTDGMDPHYSSGLFNKAFCLLVKLGGSWALDNTFQIFANANKMYWRQQTKFSMGVCGVQNSAKDILGPGSVDAVRQAFLQVGLTCPVQ